MTSPQQHRIDEPANDREIEALLTRRHKLLQKIAATHLWLRSERPAAVAIAYLTVLGVVAIAAAQISPFDPLEQDLSLTLKGPSRSHLFGTDELGRDLLSRVIHGSRISLATAVIAVSIAGTVGALCGLVAGYIQGVAGAAIMRLMDFLLAVPGILLAITIAAVLGTGFGPATIAVTIVSIPAFARLARASVLSTKEEDFVQATRCAGAGHLYLMFRTIFPNALSPLIVQASVAAANAILLEAALSFLGLGTQPPDASWGSLLSTGKSYLNQSAWYSVLPGIVLAATVLAIDILGRALQRRWGAGAADAVSGRGG